MACGVDVKKLITLSVGLFITYLCFFQNPYRLDYRTWGRLNRCGFVKTFIEDTSPNTGTYFAKPTSNLTTEELQLKHDLLEEKRKKYFFYDDGLGFPPFIGDFNAVRCEQEFTLVDSFSFWGNLRKAIFEMKLLERFANGWNEILYQGYEIMFYSPLMDFPFLSLKWKEDFYFSHARLSGVNPVTIKKLIFLPNKFELDKEKVSKFLGGSTFDEELAKGKFFIEDYEILDGIPTNNGTVIFPAICLHYLTKNNTLIPIAIQLHQKKEDDKLGVFYPDEVNPDAWLFAKVGVQLANAIHHQVITHLLYTHLVIEIWIISFHRNLNDDHPISVLLKNHLQKTIAINNEARDLLLPKIIDTITSPGLNGARSVAKRSYSTYNFTEAYLKKDLKNRGVWDEGVDREHQSLPNYDYRDFSIPIWDAIEKYVNGIVEAFYPDDSFVINDVPLQDFARDIAIEGKMRGFPEIIVSKAQLSEVLTMIIFTSSAQHAAINFNQFDHLGYTPNMPLCLTMDKLPDSKDEFTSEFIFKALPTYKKSALQTATVWALSKLPVFKEEMLVHPMKWKYQPAQKVADQFVKDLLIISKDVAKINEPRDPLCKYLVLDPINIPQATSI